MNKNTYSILLKVFSGIVIFIGLVFIIVLNLLDGYVLIVLGLLGIFFPKLTNLIRINKISLIIIGLILLFPLLWRSTQVTKGFPSTLIASTIPKYNNSTKWFTNIVCSGVVSEGSCQAKIVLKTDDEVQKVFDFYREELEMKGYTISTEGYSKDVSGNNTSNYHLGMESETGGISLSYKSNRSEYTFIVTAKR